MSTFRGGLFPGNLDDFEDVTFSNDLSWPLPLEEFWSLTAESLGGAVTVALFLCSWAFRSTRFEGRGIAGKSFRFPT